MNPVSPCTQVEALASTDLPVHKKLTNKVKMLKTSSVFSPGKGKGGRPVSLLG